MLEIPKMAESRMSRPAESLRIARAYRNMIEEAECVIVGMVSLQVIAEERRYLLRRTRNRIQKINEKSGAASPISSSVRQLK